MSITAIQMVQAMTSISNDGEVIKPYIVKKIVDSNTKEVLVENKRTVVKRVASKETVNQVRDLLDGVVNNCSLLQQVGIGIELIKLGLLVKLVLLKLLEMVDI